MRRSLLAGTTALFALAASMGMPVAQAQAAGTTCTAPVLRETMVSQGLPSYSTLVSGKTTLVKFFLSLPDTTACKSASTQGVVITGGTLTVTGALGAVNRVTTMVTPTSSAGAQLAPYTIAPADNIPGDPVFAVPGSYLAGTSSFTASFSGLLSYTVVDSKGATLTTGTTTVPATPYSRSVSVPARPLRVLVVPMGDTASTTSQFPDVANSAMTSGMQALSRQMPVADGVNDLADTAAAGVKWHLAAGMVNLGLHDEISTSGTTISRNYMSTGVFCGGGASFPYISQQLSGFLEAWNSENPAAPADRVLGAVSSTVSAGPSTGDGSTCAEGYAGIATPEAWVRAVPPATDGTRQGIAGALATLELMHTYGGSTASSTYHSPNNNADLTAPGRAYNVTTRAQLPGTSNRSTMRFGLAPWDDYTTLFEPIDFGFESCILTGGTTCGGAGATAGSVAAGGSFVLSGLTDGTVAGTDAETYFEPDQPQDGSTSTSGFNLVQRDAAGNILTGGSTGVRMTTVYSEHDGTNDNDPTAPQTTNATRFTFDVAIPAIPASPASTTQGKATTIELWKGSPGTSGALKLYSASLGGSAPTITGISSRLSPAGLRQYTTGGTGQQAAISPQGGFVAWSKPTGISIAPASSSATASAPISGEQVTWRPDGHQIAFLRSGSLYTASVDTSTTPPTVGAASLVYDASGLLGVPFDHPSYSPDGTKVAVAMAGELWSIDLTSALLPLSSITCGLAAIIPAGSLPPCARLTNTSATESQPDWGPNDIIAFTSTSGNAPSEVWTLPATTTTATKRIADGVATSSPAWAGSQLLVTRPTGIFGYDASSFIGAPMTTVSGDTGASSSDNGSVIGFDRASSGARDVFLGAMTKRTTQVTYNDDDASVDRLDLFVQCPRSIEPVVVGAHPTPQPAPGATSGSFIVTVDPTGICPNGTFVARVNDGYRVARFVGGTVTGGGTSHVAIYAPVNGQVVLQDQSIPVAGGATTPDGAASSSVTWTLLGPSGSTYVPAKTVGTGSVLNDLQPPAGGWVVGQYVLTATYNGTPAASATRTFTVTNDRDGDGIPDSQDSQAVHSCYPADAVSNASNATTDYDNDGLVSLVDPDPCSSRFNATVKFQADSVNLSSSGNYVTVTFSTTAIDLSNLQASQAVITSIGGYRTSFVATSVSGLTSSSSSLKFDRPALQTFYSSHSLHGYVPIVITVTTSQGTASGFDPSAPTYT